MRMSAPFVVSAQRAACFSSSLSAHALPDYHDPSTHVDYVLGKLQELASLLRRLKACPLQATLKAACLASSCCPPCPATIRKS
jgi:hypothetical protein